MQVSKLAVLATVSFALAVSCKHESGKLLGCYLDQGDSGGTKGRDLDGDMTTSDKNTPASCAQTCRAKGFKYAGVQYGNQCFCGNTFGKFGKKPDTDCDTKCAGNDKETCGGTWRQSVYEL